MQLNNVSSRKFNYLQIKMLEQTSISSALHVASVAIKQDASSICDQE
jgi:hypothetical protein